MLEAARAGRLRLNGQPTTDLDSPMRPGFDRVELDGRRLFIHGTPLCLALNKPPGYISTCRDERGRRTVLALVPPAFRQLRLFPVGRLDAASRGLLLLTNDGQLAYQLTHPRFGVEKEYEVILAEPLGGGALQTLRKGVTLDDGPALPARVRQVGRSPAGVRYQITLREGRNQEVRRMVAAVGGDLRDLVRTRIGSLRLGRLRPAQARLVRPEEVRALEAHGGEVPRPPSGEGPEPREPLGRGTRPRQPTPSGEERLWATRGPALALAPTRPGEGSSLQVGRGRGQVPAGRVVHGRGGRGGRAEVSP